MASGVLICVEALGVVILAVGIVISGLGNSAAAGQLLAQGAYYVVLAAALAACGIALLRGRRWGRTPAWSSSPGAAPSASGWRRPAAVRVGHRADRAGRRHRRAAADRPGERLDQPVPCACSQSRTGEPEDRPAVHRHGAQGPVEGDRRRVPVQHRPLDPGVAALAPRSRPAWSAAPCPGRSRAGRAGRTGPPGRSRARPPRWRSSGSTARTRPPRPAGDAPQPEQRGGVPNSAACSWSAVRWHCSTQPLVLGQLVDQPDDRADVLGVDRPDPRSVRHGHRTRRPDSDTYGSRLDQQVGTARRWRARCRAGRGRCPAR